MRVRASAVTSITVSICLGGVVLLSPGSSSAAECPAPAAVAEAPTWPPAPQAGEFDVVHFGEAHYNEGQGPLTMPILVQDVVARAPAFVAFSSDMADVGSMDRMTCFRSIMQPLLDADIPWFDSPGNHDRLTIANTFGGVASESIAPWRETFASMPAPWGDGPTAGPGFVVPSGEPDDGPGAATHYYLDYGPPGKPVVRLIALDNSRHSFTATDVDQYPAVGPFMTDASQLSFFARAAADARDRGLITLAMFHEPTQDPRDQTKAHPISYNHTMAKGATADNALFDTLAATTETDAVLTGHILGNFQYRVGDVAYYIDGGAGGSPYTRERTGTDTGYYYAYRLLRFSEDAEGRWVMRTFLVPLVDRIEIDVPRTISDGETILATATVVQPHDPALPPRFPLMPNEAIRVDLRPPSPGPLDGTSLPTPAYAWRTSDPSVLRPLPGPGTPASELGPATMTTSGLFEAIAPGTATLSILVGSRAESVVVTVV